MFYDKGNCRVLKTEQGGARYAS